MASNRAYQSAVYAAQDEEAKTPHAGDAVVHILSECPTLEKMRMQILDFARIDPDQIKEGKLSSIVALCKAADC